jgi:hypothetical protein
MSGYGEPLPRRDGSIGRKAEVFRCQLGPALSVETRGARGLDLRAAHRRFSAIFQHNSVLPLRSCGREWGMSLEEPTPQQRRCYLSIAKLAAVIVGTSAATALAIFIWLLRLNGAFDPEPALIRSASVESGNVDEISNKFDLAVRAKFPVGSSESDLIRELAKQKFQPEWGGRRATYSDTPIICANEYSVIWTVDEARRLTRISGEFRAICL